MKGSETNAAELFAWMLTDPACSPQVILKDRLRQYDERGRPYGGFFTFPNGCPIQKSIAKAADELLELGRVTKDRVQPGVYLIKLVDGVGNTDVAPGGTKQSAPEEEEELPF